MLRLQFLLKPWLQLDASADSTCTGLLANGMNIRRLRLEASEKDCTQIANVKAFSFGIYHCNLQHVRPEVRSLNI